MVHTRLRHIQIQDFQSCTKSFHVVTADAHTGLLLMFLIVNAIDLFSYTAASVFLINLFTYSKSEKKTSRSAVINDVHITLLIHECETLLAVSTLALQCCQTEALFM